MKNLVNARHSLLTFLSCAGILVASSAFATTTITNLADIPYDLEVSQSGGAMEPISIEPGRNWKTNANPVTVAVGKRKVRLEPGAEYTIWKDGTFTQQRSSIYDRKR